MPIMSFQNSPCPEETETQPQSPGREIETREHAHNVSRQIPSLAANGYADLIRCLEWRYLNPNPDIACLLAHLDHRVQEPLQGALDGFLINGNKDRIASVVSNHLCVFGISQTLEFGNDLIEGLNEIEPKA